MTDQPVSESPSIDRFVDHPGAWIIAFDDSWSVSMWNDAAQTATGYTTDDFDDLDGLLGLLIPDPIEQTALHEAFDRIDSKSSGPSTIETGVRTRDGATRFVVWSVSLARDRSNGSWLATAVGVDVTQWHSRELVHRRNESFHRHLLESIQDGIWWIDGNGVTRYMNSRLARMLGVNAPDVVAQPASGIWPDAYRALTGRVQAEVSLQRSDGSLAIVHISGGPVQPDETGIDGAILGVLDISEHRRVSHSHALLTQAVEHASESVMITDVDGRIEYVNPAFARITGYSAEEAIGQTSSILQSGAHSKAFYQNLWKVIGSGREWKGVLRNRRKDGTLYTEEESISPVRNDDGEIVGYLGVKRDVTHEHELQQFVQSTQKLQAIGTLAGGIAHDFNNILMAILGYASIARGEVEPTSAVAAHLEQITRAGERATELANQLLTFSRGNPSAGVTDDPSAAVDEAVRLMRSTTPTSVQITSVLPERLPAVVVDPTQLVQVVMNLVINAVRATEHRDAGRVIVTGSVEQGGVADNQSASTHVRITVADNGCGMDPETQRRIFEPFFSTRAVGQGTGMGMPVVHGIVTGAGGTVTVDSTPDAGTVFTIRLPAHQPEPCVSPTLPRADAAEAAARPDGDSDEHHPAADLPIAPRVLLVDDEPALVDLLATSLTRAGFRVSGYTDALEALTSIKVDADPYDVVLTDITMPGLRGDQLATRIHESDRSLPIIGYTGHSDRVDREGAVEAGMVDLLAKPLDPNEVIEALKRALRRRGGIDG